MHKLILASAVIACLWGMATALKCHQCSSYSESMCGDPFHFEPTREGEEKRPKTNEFLKECPNDGKNYTICRKIYQNVRGDVRIIRSCGYEQYTKGDCYKTVLEEYNTYVCQCEGDGCNGAGFMQVSFLSMLTALVVSRFL